MIRHRRPNRQHLFVCLEQLESRRLLAMVPFVGEVQPGQPVAFMSNGGNGCCVSEVVGQFLSDSGAVVKVTNWNDIMNEDGSATAPGNTPGIFDPVPSDATTFLAQIDQAISAIPADSPLILLGHSWGGNSMLKTTKLTTYRDIEFLGLYDPVGDSGLRSNVINDTTGGISGVPANVDYFFNRWQQNSVFFNGVPFDSASTSGLFTPDRSDFSDQARQDDSRDSAGNPIGGQLKHSLVPYDDYIETQTIQAIADHVAFPPVANAGQDQFVTAGESVSLVAVATDANPNDTLSFAWNLASYQPYPGGPIESIANPLANPNVANSTFVPTTGGVWTFDLTVTDSTQRQATDRIVVTATMPPASSFVSLLDQQVRMQATNFTPGSNIVFAWGTAVGNTYYSQFDMTLEIADATFTSPMEVGADATVSADLPVAFVPDGQTYLFQAFDAASGAQATDLIQLNIAGLPLVVSDARSDWQNPSNHHDVNRDLRVTPQDALIVINRLNQTTGVYLIGSAETDFLIDVNGDQMLTPIDALQVMNALNRNRLDASAAFPVLIASASQRSDDDREPYLDINYEYFSLVQESSNMTSFNPAL